jgi:glycine/serine hydroxymethyltransferase
MTGPDPHTIDFGQVAELIRRHSPTLIYVDQSTCLFPLNVARLVEVTRRTAPSTLVHIDCSHWLGLIFGGQFDNPLELGADSFGGSTHKSFPGPQKAVVATNRKDLWDRIYQAQFEMISSHHFAETISLGIALLEFRDCGGAVYAERVLENTRTFGRQLHNLGIDVAASERGFSAGHQLWIKPSASGVDAAAASDRLYGAGIRVNVFPELPGIPEPAIRIGLNEATYHGLVVTDMAELASIFAAALLNLDDPGSLARRTAQLRLRYRQPYSFSKNRDGLADSALRLLSYALGAGPNRGEGAGFTGAFGRADNGAYE